MNNSSPIRHTRLQDIADRCGVALSTASCALGGGKGVSPSTCERIRSIARDMGYDPSRHHTARRLASSKFGRSVINRVIGIFFYHPDFGTTDYYTKLIQGALVATADNKFQLMTCDTNVFNTELPDTFRRGDIDGVLMVAVEGEYDAITDLLRAEPGFGDRPIVGIVDHITGCSAVYPDHVAVGYLAVSHLLELGHRTILQFQDFPVLQGLQAKRKMGYLQAFKDQHLDPEGRIVGCAVHFDDHERSDSLLLDALRAHPEITAIVARNDDHASMIYSALQHAGLRVPQDMSLIGCDDTEVIVDEHQENLLTTVRLPLRRIGYDGTKLLISRILGKEKRDQDVVMPVELIVRKTSGPPRNHPMPSL